jgi:RNA polymerase sigma-70 factor (ECF subfamily)
MEAEQPVSETDEALMRRCAGGDRAAFEELAARYRPRLVAMARKWLDSVQSAEDAAQDVLVAAFRHRHRYQPQDRFAAWLFTLAANHLRNLVRARRRRQRALGMQAGDDEGLAAPAEASLDAAVLWDALGGLPPYHRAALLLHDLYGFDHEEIAALFGVAAGTVRSWTTRARKEARRRLEASEFGRRRTP